MARAARYTEQMPWVGTPTQKDLIVQEATRERISQADVVRRAIDNYYNLDDGEIRTAEKVEKDATEPVYQD